MGNRALVYACFTVGNRRSRISFRDCQEPLVMSHKRFYGVRNAPNDCDQIERTTDATTYAGKVAPLHGAEEVPTALMPLNSQWLPLGGKLEGWTVPSSDILAHFISVSRDHEPSHRSKSFVFSSVASSGTTLPRLVKTVQLGMREQHGFR